MPLAWHNVVITSDCVDSVTGCLWLCMPALAGLWA